MKKEIKTFDEVLVTLDNKDKKKLLIELFGYSQKLIANMTIIELSELRNGLFNDCKFYELEFLNWSVDMVDKLRAIQVHEEILRRKDPIQEVSSDFILNLIRDSNMYIEVPSELKVKVWCKEPDGTYTACDNSKGEAWTEHFKNFESVKAYLLDGVPAEELEIEPKPTAKIIIHEYRSDLIDQHWRNHQLEKEVKND